MRAFVVTLLLMLIVGVNMANAFSGARKTASQVDRPAVSLADAGASSGPLLSHHLACCKDADRQGPKAKVSHCGADCVSLQPGEADLAAPAASAIEFSPSAELKALTPVPAYIPPISA